MEIAPISSYTGDTLNGRDLLGINPDVDALAQVIASREITPPLSIGLFGTEASGKSFFLYKLHHRVSELAQVAQQAASESAYCSQIVQVDYNAWHHMGANQWLGLVERIFIELDRVYSTSAAGKEFIPISSARRIMREFESKIARATTLRHQAEEDHKASMLKHDAAIRAQAAGGARSRWAAINEVFSKQISSDNDCVSAINSAGKKLGLADLALNAEHLDQVLEQAKSISGRAGLMTSSLKAKRFAGNAFLAFLGILLLGIFVLIVSRLYASDPRTSIETIGKGLTAVSTLAGFAGLWIAAMLRNRASQAIDTLQRFGPKLRDAIQQTDESRNYDQVINAERVAISQKILEEHRARVAETSKSLVTALQARSEFLAEGVFHGVVEHYRKLIQTSDRNLSASVVPTIREDFESLMRALEDSRQEHAGYSMLERVVVYIDDLDQCPPEVIITVLQAVHLLLSFPLFVVVIAANPIRLIDSISSNYMALQDSARAPGRTSKNQALAFLSKLIQIPFWVRTMTMEGATHLINDAVPSEPHTTFAGPMSEMDPTGKPDPTGAPTPALSSDPRDVQPRPFTDGEMSFLMEAGALIGGTPRDAKRFINIYRLLRATVDWEALIDEQLPLYPALITELAIVVSVPESAAFFFAALQSRDHSSLSQFLGDLRARNHFVLERGEPVIEPADLAVIERLLDVYRSRRDDSEAFSALKQVMFKVARFSFTNPN
jgi:KAP family P-loop domain